MSSNSSLFRNHAVEIALGAGAVVALSAYAYKKLSKPKNKITRIIDTMEVFKKSSVHMRDPDYVEDMVSFLIKGGASRLQVISDFDHTISRVHLNGLQCTTTYGILEAGPLASEEQKRQARKLYDHYYPIEIDPYLTVEEKTPYMKEWYTESQQLMVNFGIKKGDITEMVSTSNAVLRDGCDTLFHTLYSHDVPLLIFSAGVGDVLKEILKQQGLLYPNVKIIANFMNFNEEEKLLGFKGELIHTFNKNRSSMENSDYFEHLKIRHNIILLGDNLGDVHMADGVKDANCLLKIGFLNSKIEENLPRFLNTYDIVLTDDQTMDVLNGLLQCIL